jgi:16S rRNA (guanine527-N7)-methyltransferase
VETLADVLAQAREYGFLGPGPVEAHAEHALGFAAGFDAPPARFVDLGSGGGVPGLVLLELWPDSQAVLLDSNERRTGFLVEALAALGWGSRAEVIRARAEDAGRDDRLRGAFPAVVARGFASPPVTAECGAPLLRVGGRLVVSEPPEELGRWSPDGLERLGLEAAGTVVQGARYQVLVQRSPCPDQFPRRVGVPGKRPLW